MTFPNIFTEEVSQQVVGRINKLAPETQAQWGKMNVAQMMAHCNVAYDFVYTDKYPRPKGLKKFLVTLFAKKAVTGPKPYAKNGRTAPEFLVASEQDFKAEQGKLTDYLAKVAGEGEGAFEGRASHAFGSLTAEEWNNSFYKHLDHHLTQFGV